MEKELYCNFCEKPIAVIRLFEDVRDGKIELGTRSNVGYSDGDKLCCGSCYKNKHFPSEFSCVWGEPVDENVSKYKYEALVDVNNFRESKWEKGETRVIETKNGVVPENVQNLEFEGLIKKVGKVGEDDKIRELMNDG